MNNPSNPTSIIAPYIESFLQEKRTSGFDYRTEKLLLLRFDRYCNERKLRNAEITKDFLQDWCMKLDTECNSQLSKRISVVRRLLLHMVSLGVEPYIPRNDVHRELVLPHIFTDKELKELFIAVDGYIPKSPSFVHRRMANEYRILFRMLYCCGLRNSECCGIPAECVDLESGTLMVLDSKGHKDRLVKMADDLTELCRRYWEYIGTWFGYSPKWFFPGKNPESHIPNTSVDMAFTRIWETTPSARQCNNKPTPHDLRFTFITDRINEWAKDGTDVNAMMPYLQRYVGHKSLKEVYYYYHTSSGLYDVISKFDSLSAVVIPEVKA
jgi:integrase